MIRIDIRARVDSLDSMITALEQINFKLLENKKECEIYYNVDRDDLKNSKQVLCLLCRENVSTGDKKAQITYKSPGTDSFSITDLEYETEVGDFNSALGIFDNLGYQRAAELRRDRQILTNFEGVNAYLDDICQLGKFLELEILLDEDSRQEYALEALIIILNELGVHKSAIVTKTYLEMLA